MTQRDIAADFWVAVLPCAFVNASDGTDADAGFNVRLCHRLTGQSAGAYVTPRGYSAHYPASIPCAVFKAFVKSRIDRYSRRAKR